MRAKTETVMDWDEVGKGMRAKTEKREMRMDWDEWRWMGMSFEMLWSLTHANKRSAAK